MLVFVSLLLLTFTYAFVAWRAFVRLKRSVTRRLAHWAAKAEEGTGLRAERERELERILFGNEHFSFLSSLTTAAPLLGLLTTVLATQTFDLGETDGVASLFETIQPAFIGVGMGASIGLTNLLFVVPLARAWLQSVWYDHHHLMPGSDSSELQQTLILLLDSLEGCALKAKGFGEELGHTTENVVQSGNRAIAFIEAKANDAAIAVTKQAQETVASVTDSANALLGSIAQSAQESLTSITNSVNPAVKSVGHAATLLVQALHKDTVNLQHRINASASHFSEDLHKLGSSLVDSGQGLAAGVADMQKASQEFDRAIQEIVERVVPKMQEALIGERGVYSRLLAGSEQVFARAFDATNSAMISMSRKSETAISPIAQAAAQLRESTETLARQCLQLTDVIRALQEAAATSLAIARNDVSQLQVLFPVNELCLAVTELTSVAKTIVLPAQAKRHSQPQTVRKQHRTWWTWVFGRNDVSPSDGREISRDES